MKNVLTNRHREMMSILDYCDNQAQNRDLHKILQGLRIDNSGQPRNQEIFDLWVNIAEQTMEKSTKDFSIFFLEQMLEKNMPLLESAISLINRLSDEKISELQSIKVNYWNRSDIKIEQDYKDMLRILDRYYFQSYNDDLGALLGCLSMDIWADRLPADLADYGIWLDSIEPIKDSDIVTKIVTFLEKFSSEFKTFDFETTIFFVKSLSEEQIKEITQSNSNT